MYIYIYLCVIHTVYVCVINNMIFYINSVGLLVLPNQIYRSYITIYI